MKRTYAAGYQIPDQRDEPPQTYYCSLCQCEISESEHNNTGKCETCTAEDI